MCDSNPPTSPAFPGFPDFRANVTFTPIQFFTVVVPTCARGTVRIIGYALRKALGWVDAHGNTRRPGLKLSYRELIEQAGVSREAIADALAEAIKHRCLRCATAPHPDQAGQPAQSGIYELCWDYTGPYTDDPGAFNGFYYPEAALVEEPDGSTTVRRPKSARKNIPNAYFDVLLRRERLSVIRVVGALMFYSIKWGPGGERKEPVSLSVTELSRLTRLSRKHVHEAVKEARQRGYIEQVDAGCFDVEAAKESRAAIYGIRWMPAPLTKRMPSPVAEGGVGSEPPNHGLEADRSEKEYGEVVRKGARNQSEKEYGNRSEKVNGISIKKDLKTETAAEAAADTTAVAAAVATELELLKQTGFDDATARMLAAKQPGEVIRRQVQWLALRKATLNRLGLLRRAIEKDWPRPEGAPPDESLVPGRLFASHYYAAYHGFSGEAGTEPLPKDAKAAAVFVDRLLKLRDEPASVPDWGRQFGGMVRQRHQGDASARPNLSVALALHGDAFLRQVGNRGSAFASNARQKAQAARHAALWPAYMAYLRQAEIEAQKSACGLYEAFAAQRRRTREAMAGGLFQAAPETLARFDGEESRLLALAEYCAGRKPNVVLSFEQWSSQLPDSTAAAATTAQARVLSFPKPDTGPVSP